MIEIEVGKDSTFIYVPKVPLTKSLVKRLERLKQPTADYWSNWNIYCKTVFSDNLASYDKRSCIGHSWTFNSKLVADKLKKIVGTIPYSIKITEE